MTRISKINSEELYKDAKKRYNKLKKAKEGSHEHAEAEQLKAVIKEYEDENVTVTTSRQKATPGSRGTRVSSTPTTGGTTGRTSGSRGKRKS